jgi:hypothetical protein
MIMSGSQTGLAALLDFLPVYLTEGTRFACMEWTMMCIPENKMDCSWYLFGHIGS